MLLSNLQIIVATDIRNGIGKNNTLPWHISEDLKRFKQLTLGHYLILGRKTWDSLPFRPLPGRKHVILSSKLQIHHPDVICFPDINGLLDFVRDHHQEQFFVIGGSSLYEQFLAYTPIILLTRIYNVYDVDTFFPPFAKEFKMIKSSELLFDEKEKKYFRFCTYERKKS